MRALVTYCAPRAWRARSPSPSVMATSDAEDAEDVGGLFEEPDEFYAAPQVPHICMRQHDSCAQRQLTSTREAAVLPRLGSRCCSRCCCQRPSPQCSS
jgi:hypothetical protein